MYQICASGSNLGLELLCFLSVSQAGVAVMVLLWQLALFGYGFHPFKRLAQTLPFLVAELRIGLSLYYWMRRISRRVVYAKHYPPLPSVLGSQFLICRDGQHIFDFFKTYRLADISPPARARV